jgi:transcriptional regulator with PAS, ATPase and Fis domain
LGQLLAAGQFREDLFYRVNVIPIQVPPLRDRLEDIPLLAEAFIERSRLKTKKRIGGISKEALEKLMSHQWPGNVRELINAIEFAFVLCPEGNILPEHLPNLTNPKSLHQSNSHPKTHISQEQSKEVLLKALATAGGNKAEAARILGVSRVTLWKRLKKYNLQQALEEEPEEGIKKGKKNVLVRI